MNEKSQIQIKKPFGYCVKTASDTASFESVNDSLTKQSFKDECDINKIIDKFHRTGQLPDFRAQGFFADLVDHPTSLHEAMTIVVEAKEAFSQLPSNIRNRFNNDPQQLMTFLSDPQNVDEGIRLGLFEKLADEPVKASQTTPPAVGEGGTGGSLAPSST